MLFTLFEPCQYSEEIRKSRFITYAAPVASVAEAQDFIARRSDLNATHNCWAWKLGEQYRSNDDGEPGGTAGRPILAAIQAQACDQVVVLVVRWYGGIQLGAGGLARAYGGGANKCLQLGAKRPLIQRVQAACSCTFSELQRVKLYVADIAGVVEQETFTASGADLLLAVEPHQVPWLRQQLADLSRGRLQLKVDEPHS